MVGADEFGVRIALGAGHTLVALTALHSANADRIRFTSFLLLCFVAFRRVLAMPSSPI